MPKKYEWTSQALEMVRDRFPREGTSSLAKDLRISRGLVMKKALQLGLISPTGIREVLLRNKTNLKVSYFRLWSSEMAYDLGYIWADGSVSRSKKQGILTLRCSSNDEEIILGVSLS